MNITASFFTNSYNRLPLLKNLIHSFEICNVSHNVEWIITDYGSIDGSRSFLRSYAKNASYPVTLVFGDERKYFQKLSITPVDQRVKTWAILRKYRNDARKQSRGRYIFDVGSDHQFVRKADFIGEVDNVLSHRKRIVGYDDVSCITTFGYFRGRLDKVNNARSQEYNSDEVPYFVATKKQYVDYGVMKKATIERVGPFLELTQIRRNTKEMEMWMRGDAAVFPEPEYEKRCASMNLHRLFIKYPFTVSFTNDRAKEIIEQPDARPTPIEKIWTTEELLQTFGWLQRPLSSEEICGLLAPSRIERSIARIQARFSLM